MHGFKLSMGCARPFKNKHSWASAAELAAHVHWCLRRRYFVASALNGLCSSFNMMLTSVADLMRQSHRATSVAFMGAMFAIGLIVGPLLGAYLSQQMAGKAGH